MFDRIDLHYLHLAIVDRPPDCLRCGRPTKGRIVQRGDLNGNGGRPYYFCEPCNKLSCFADMEDIEQENPDCDCGMTTRRQTSGLDTDPPGLMYYRCLIGGCDFFDWVYDGEGESMRTLFDVPDEKEKAREEGRLY
ncbi:hypothetical protein BJX66DRAFT_345318 [Aspergillus keveii]|uniref:GRF-like zinc ribbon domain-containing protein n=1 Tax=Aspergillus keveii TaxID=714993 RepID=A0ABR4FJ07_9EURO